MFVFTFRHVLSLSVGEGEISCNGEAGEGATVAHVTAAPRECHSPRMSARSAPQGRRRRREQNVHTLAGCCVRTESALSQKGNYETD